MTRALPIALLLALAACARPQPAPIDGGAAGVRCDANAVRKLVGRPAAAATIDAAKRLSGAQTVRRYATGDAVTMDFRPDRLNVETDSAGTIVRLGCG